MNRRGFLTSLTSLVLFPRQRVATFKNFRVYYKGKPLPMIQGGFTNGSSTVEIEFSSVIPLRYP